MFGGWIGVKGVEGWEVFPLLSTLSVVFLYFCFMNSWKQFIQDKKDELSLLEKGETWERQLKTTVR